MKKPTTIGAAAAAVHRTEDKMREAETRLRRAALTFAAEHASTTGAGQMIESELYAAALARTSAYHAHSRAKKHATELAP